MLNVNNNHV